MVSFKCISSTLSIWHNINYENINFFLVCLIYSVIVYYLIIMFKICEWKDYLYEKQLNQSRKQFPPVLVCDANLTRIELSLRIRRDFCRWEEICSSFLYYFIKMLFKYSIVKLMVKCKLVNSMSRFVTEWLRCLVV